VKLHPAHGKRPLSLKTVLEIHLIIRGALDAAARRGIVTINVALVAHRTGRRSAAREAACCPFMKYDITADDTEIRWETSGNAEVQPILDKYYSMYEEITAMSTQGLFDGFAERGFEVRSDAARFEYNRVAGHR